MQPEWYVPSADYVKLHSVKISAVLYLDLLATLHCLKNQAICIGTFQLFIATDTLPLQRSDTSGEVLGWLSVCSK